MFWIGCLVSFLIISPTNANFPIPDFQRSEVTERQDAGSYRLPNEVIPENYYLTLDPNFDTWNYTGTVEIVVRVVRNTNTITLHSVGHTLQNFIINCVSPTEESSNVTVDNFTLDSRRQFLILELSENITTDNECTLLIEFEGVLNEEQHGFYRGEYTEQDGTVRRFATTQFEPTYAREAFPCFDEPGLKAEFEITIIRSLNYHSLSNSPLYNSMIYVGNRRADLFGTTPRISTYLVAFVVSELANVSSGYQSVYGRPELIAEGRGDLALSFASEVLPAIEQFVGIPYNSSMPKMDNVAIPNDYFVVYGAMENWGLVIYRESYLLTRDDISTSMEIENVATIISHEYGHQWFGNLVSPAWWNYIWINEGFATYFEFYGVSVARPSWRLMERFALTTLQSVFQSDQLQSTRPMTYDAETPGEISALFDRIAYNKAGAVIRMVENFITTPVFRNGLNRFLVNNSLGVATEYELWRAIGDAVTEAGLNLGVTFENLMETWTQQAGFPLVTVTVSPTSRAVTITQERFVLDNSTYESNETWIIPFSYVVSSNPDFTDTGAALLIRSRVEAISYYIQIEPGEWIIANVQQTGYYRVNYDNENWRLIINYLNSDSFTNIHPSNRAQLIDDSLVLARAGRIPYDTALDLISYLSRETDYVPLYSSISNLNFLNRILSASPNITLFRDFYKDLLQSAFDQLTAYESTNDDHVDRLNRVQVLTTLCGLNHEACLRDTSNQLRTWQPISPDLQSAVYCGGLRSGGEEEWNFLYNLYIANTTERFQRNRILSSLSCTENTTLLNRVLDMVFYQSTNWPLLSNSDRLPAITGLYTNSENGISVLLNMNFSILFYSFSVSNVNTILNGLSLRLTRRDQQELYTRILQLEESSQWATHGAAFTNSLRNIDQINEWVSNYQDGINNWLVERLVVPTTTTPITSSSTSSTTSATSTSPDGGSDGSIAITLMPILLLCPLVLLYT